MAVVCHFLSIAVSIQPHEADWVRSAQKFRPEVPPRSSAQKASQSTPRCPSPRVPRSEVVLDGVLFFKARTRGVRDAASCLWLTRGPCGEPKNLESCGERRV
eukprot:3936678-Rhodomonas_salina.1